MSKLLVISECPELWLEHVYATGHWTNPYAETFSETEGGVPIHLHIYNIQLATKAFKEKILPIASTITTVSYAF